MNIKKIFLIVISILMIITTLILPSVTFAATETINGVPFELTASPTDTHTGEGYAISKESIKLQGGHTIFNLTLNDNGVLGQTVGNLYCINAGKGFTENSLSSPIRYTNSYDLIDKQSTLVSTNIIESTNYRQLVYLANKFYDINYETDNTKKLELVKNALTEAGKSESNVYTDDTKTTPYLVSDTLMKAIQQLTIWHYTNQASEWDKYDSNIDNLIDSTWLKKLGEGQEIYSSLSDTAKKLNTQSMALLNYFIRETDSYITAHASDTDEQFKTGLSKEPVTFTSSTTLPYTLDGSSNIVGPITFTKNISNAISGMKLTVTNGTSDINYKVLNSNKTEDTASNIIDSTLVGEEGKIYIKVDSSIKNVNIGFSGTYTETTANVYTDENNENQPVMLINREPKTIEYNATSKLETKTFDLALRKYITKVNGVEVTNSRVPVIDKTTLVTGTTATYRHKKDPVIVENGNTVTYKLTVYNEGEKDGRATKIVDQLPTGLQFSKVVSGNFEKSSYDETSNKLVLTRNNSNSDNLKAYDSSNNADLASETIEIECKVTATADSKNKTILTNVAWIAEEYDAVDSITITNQNGKDRDSEPSTTPSVTKDNMSNYTGNNNKEELSDSTYYYKGQQDDDDFEKLVLLPKSFDLKLIKRITAVNENAVTERIEDVDVSKLNTLDENGKVITTGDYKLTKDPVSVKKGDIVTYTFRIYNEGDIDGYASEITEDVPEGLQFIYSEDPETDTKLTDEEKEAVKFNNSMLWEYADTTLKTIKTAYLSKDTSEDNLIKGFGSNDGTKTEKDISYKEVSIKLKVISDNVTGTVIRNEAEISEDTDSDGKPVDDRDSDTEKWVKYEDDEDYDNIKLQSFDLALRKFIIAVSDDETVENSDKLENSDGSYTRAPQVDTSKLNTKDEDGNVITTAIYNHPKTPVEVTKGDFVIYSLRVYNEGEIDGYATEITDHLPPYLEFVKGDYNTKNGWTVSEDGRTVKTSYLADSKISKATTDENGAVTKLDYKEVTIMCKVTDKAKTNEAITNIADITEFKDENKKDVNDRDSEKNNVKLPEDDKLPTYKDDEKGNYVPGQQDDDDFEKVVIKRFDLALRKFITEVNDDEVTTRIPQVKYDSTTGKITYEHTKEPVDVVSNDIVTYTIRVFNEGEVNGFAKEVKDDIPAGLEFLPENETNTSYRWEMLDKDGKVTTEITSAVSIVTDYLSKEQGEARMKLDSELKENPALLTAFDGNKEISDTNPDYADVKVAFKVVEPNTSDKIIINSAQISDDSDENGKDVDDDDSVPDKWNDGEDDQDKEYIKLTYFDLSLRKWVTQAIVIEDGKETVTNTGHQPYDEPEEVVKVELNRKKLSNLVVKFRYSIRITNEGDIAGYAKEITDYVPKGLKFVAEDNKGWTDEGNNVISTRLLENTLLQPGETADVEVLLTWINGNDNLGLKTNTAEISEDYNEKHAHDIDSTPDNKVNGEDDIDDAPVILSVTTGQVRIYFLLGFTVLITIAGGVVLIKKYVL